MLSSAFNEFHEQPDPAYLQAGAEAQRRGYFISGNNTIRSAAAPSTFPLE
jgi:hypothetical protein